MNSIIKVSVVLPAYNEEKYIEMLLFQISRLNPYEIIVADAHSSDNTAKIAKKYGAKVVTARKGAASYARNAGGRAATGDVILFLDADSIVFPNILDVVRKDFRSRKLAGWTCSIYGFTPSWKDQVIYNLSNNLVNFLTSYAKKPHAPGIVIAVRKNAFDMSGGFDESLTVMEDHDFAMRIGNIGSFKFSKKTCVYTSTRRMETWGRKKLITKYSDLYLRYFINRDKFRKGMDSIDYEAIR